MTQEDISKRWFSVLTILVVAVSILFLTQSLAVSSSYISMYEGAKATFIGMESPGGLVYTNEVGRGSSVHTFDSTMNFDEDDAQWDKPNIRGEMTAVFIPDMKVIPPEKLRGVSLPQSWWRNAQLWKNPSAVYEWDIPGSEGIFPKKYRVEEWQTLWFLSLSAEMDSGPDFFQSRDESNNQRYRNWRVWIELDINPVWVFEGTEETYFAISQVELINFQDSSKDRYGNIVESASTMSVIPESPGSIITIYIDPFGDISARTPDELRTFHARNTTLNPQYFRDKVYIKIELSDFGTTESGPLWSRVGSGDVATLGFRVTQFVVGEWLIKPKSTIPDEYERTAKVGEAKWIDLSGLGDFFGSPNMTFMIMLVGGFLFIYLLFSSRGGATIIGHLLGRNE